MSITKKLLILILSLTIIPMSFIGMLDSINAREALRQTTLEGLNIISEFREGEIFLYLERLKTRTVDFSTDGSIGDYLENRMDEDINDHLLRHKKPIDEQLLLIDVLDLNGKVVASSMPRRIGTDESQKSYFVKGREGPYLSNIRQGERGILELVASAPVKPHHGTNSIGVLVNYFDVSDIDRMMTGDMILSLGAKTQQRGMGETGETYLVNQDRLMVTNSLFIANASFNQKVDTYPVRKCLEENEEVRGVWPDYRGVSVAGASMCFDFGDFRWVLVSEADEKEVFAPMEQLRKLSIVTGIILLILVSIVALSTAKLISSPIIELTESARVIAGEMSYNRIDPQLKDLDGEIGQLARAFDKMTVSLIQANAHLDQKVRSRTKELEEAMDKLKSSSQLVQTEKMGAVGTMAAGVAHELNNPMMGILNYIQYCMKKTPPDDKRHEILKDAEHEVKRCMGIVRNLLSFSRMEKEGAEDFRQVSVHEIIDRVLSLLSYRIGRDKVEVIRDTAKDLPMVFAQANKLQQVFLNIVNNALDALDGRPKKEIHIQCRQGRLKGSLTVDVSFIDTGAGIPEKDMEKILMPFFTTKPPGQGTGLGLAVCDGIIKDHGGELACESKLDHGTKMTVSLRVERRKS